MSTQEDIIVKARGVTKVYTMGAEKVHALRGIDLDVRRGEYLSILGPSGSGKSTFFNMVGGLDRPTEGHVEIDGYSLSDLNQKQLAWVRCHKMGYIFQSFNLIMTMTALENVALPRIFAGESPAKAREAAADHPESMLLVIRNKLVRTVQAKQAAPYKALGLSDHVHRLVDQYVAEALRGRPGAGKLPLEERLSDAAGRIYIALPQHATAKKTVFGNADALHPDGEKPQDRPSGLVECQVGPRKVAPLHGYSLVG